MFNWGHWSVKGCAWHTLGESQGSDVIGIGCHGNDIGSVRRASLVPRDKDSMRQRDYFYWMPYYVVISTYWFPILQLNTALMSGFTWKYGHWPIPPSVTRSVHWRGINETIVEARHLTIKWMLDERQAVPSCTRSHWADGYKARRYMAITARVFEDFHRKRIACQMDLGQWEGLVDEDAVSLTRSRVSSKKWLVWF
jgi:hypothetical protein